MKKSIILSAIALSTALSANAKIWRVNNNTGINADFTQISTAVASASVVNGDTIHVEPSATHYNTFILNKQLVFIGVGYGLDQNPGLQATSEKGITIGTPGNLTPPITFSNGASGSKFYGLFFEQYLQLPSPSTLNNILFENCFFTYNNSYPYTLGASGSNTYSNFTFRQCYFEKNFNSTPSTSTFNNLTIENCIFNAACNINIAAASSGLIFRNNTVNGVATMAGFYVANNIFLSPTANSFNTCVIRNNLFVTNQSGVTTGALSTNGNNLVSQTRASLIADAGSFDGKYQLAVGSPAIGGGVEINAVKPDCGAFGGTDPYLLSGIAPVPSIYSQTFPNGNATPAGSNSILVNFSSKDNK